jgi:hypothetical protein
VGEVGGVQDLGARCLDGCGVAVVDVGREVSEPVAVQRIQDRRPLGGGQCPRTS